jgi:nucleoside-diphosphate-sugar epimerase
MWHYHCSLFFRVFDMDAASVLVTGGSGFLGGALIKHLASVRKLSLTAPVRNLSVILPPEVQLLSVVSLGGDTDWRNALVNIEVVVHAAARVHVLNDSTTEPLAEYRSVNVDGTLNLARQAAAAGVKRFIFISSIKVNGEFTSSGGAFTADDSLAPSDPYGISKFEAEQGLLEIAAATSMEIVIIRPPLIYGPGVGANFLSMMRWVYKGIPLPLGAVHNARSLVSLENLIDFIVVCIDHPNASNQTFLVSDDQDVSTTELLHKIGCSLGRPACLVPVPSWLLCSASTLVGKRSLAQRLLGSLQVDIKKNNRLLGWKPPVRMDDALESTAQYFLEYQRK